MHGSITLSYSLSLVLAAHPGKPRLSEAFNHMAGSSNAKMHSQTALTPDSTLPSAGRPLLGKSATAESPDWTRAAESVISGETDELSGRCCLHRRYEDTGEKDQSEAGIRLPSGSPVHGAHIECASVGVGQQGVCHSC